MKIRRYLVIILVLFVVVIAFAEYKDDLKNSFVIKGNVESVFYDSVLLNVEYSDSEMIVREETPMIYLKGLVNLKQYKKGDKISARCGDLIQPNDPPYVFAIEILE